MDQVVGSIRFIRHTSICYCSHEELSRGLEWDGVTSVVDNTSTATVGVASEPRGTELVKWVARQRLWEITAWFLLLIIYGIIPQLGHPVPQPLGLAVAV